MEIKKFDKELAKKRMVLLTGWITGEKVDSIRYWLTVLNLQSDEEIKLIIDSEGGDLEPGLWLFDFLLLLNSPVTGIVNGRCESSVLVILQGCKTRKTTKHSQFYCHFVNSNITIPLNEDFDKTLKARVEKTKRNQRRIEEILSSRAGKSVDEIRNLIKEGEKYKVILSAEQVKEIGFVDEVIEEYKLFL